MRIFLPQLSIKVKLVVAFALNRAAKRLAEASLEERFNLERSLVLDEIPLLSEMLEELRRKAVSSSRAFKHSAHSARGRG